MDPKPTYSKPTYCVYCGFHVDFPCKSGDENQRCQVAQGWKPEEQVPAFYEANLKAKEGGGQDNVVLPGHYTQWELEPITFIMTNNIPWCEANVIKYVMRWKAKNGLEDLQKARRYIDMLIEKEFGEGA